MTEKLRWGILATGNIARKFATGLTALDDAEILAVGSRTLESADRFGDQFDIPGVTPTTKPWPTTPTWTPSTSARPTLSTRRTRCSACATARRCSAKSPSPSTPPKRARSSPRRGRATSSSWRPCGPATCRWWWR
ncbi:MAG: hypothetical protein R2854_00575 [Caldilineaceae bacterium]